MALLWGLLAALPLAPAAGAEHRVALVIADGGDIGSLNDLVSDRNLIAASPQTKRSVTKSIRLVREL